MTDVNVFVVAGYVTKVDALTGEGDKAYLRFSVVNKRSAKVGNEWKDEPSFFNFIVFGKRAIGLSKYLAKGSFVTVSGRLKQDKYTKKDGTVVNQVGFAVDIVQLQGKSNSSGNNSSSQSSNSRQYSNDTAQLADDAWGDANDIPAF